MAHPDRRPSSHRLSTIGLASTVVPALLFLAGCWFWPAVADGRVFIVDAPWLPSLDLSLRFRIDGLSLLFSLIVTGAGTFVSLYSAGYLAGHHHCGRFFFYLHAFMLSMLGLVTADNLLLLFVFWEATTIFSYLLIGFDHESASARENARQSLLITSAGGLALLIGILLLKIAGGSYIISSWTTAGDAIRQHALYPAIFTGIFLGAATKSAQFPFHFWLPNAMSAPTPISAFLHAATMVKAGIYLLMRCHPLLGGTTSWTVTLVVIGGLTAVWGAVQAMGPRDLKRILAYTTMMALGILTMFLGGQTAPALTAAVTFLLVHALYKAALFLAVGAIDHETGTRDLDRLGGLWRAMPLSALAVAAAAMSMAGFPLFFGFIGKEIMYEGALTKDMFPHFSATAALLANSLMTAVAAILLLGPFFGKTPPARTVAEAPWVMWLGPFVMGGLGIAFGLVPGWVGAVLIEPAVRAFHPGSDQITLAIYHGLNLPLLLSMLTLSLGAALYLLRHSVQTVVVAAVKWLPGGAEQAYSNGLDLFMKAAERITGRLQNGSLHFYLAVIVLTTTVAVAWPWLGTLHRLPLSTGTAASGTVTALVVFIAGAVVVVLTARKRLAAIGGLGGVGAGVALLFLLFGAPDIALTQLLVETLTVIFVSLVLLRLPAIEQTRRRSNRRRLLDGALSAGVGLLFASLLVGIGTGELDRSITDFFEANSYLLAHGRNIVNVILVDFRSFDTLGEIIVVVLAAWAAVTLIRKPMEP